MKNEQILIIPRSRMEKVLGEFQGFKPASNEELKALLPYAEFTERGPAETNPAQKQLIPYCILTHKSKILQYERGSAGGENRLKSKKSLGIGGHINPIDFLPGEKVELTTYENATQRELQEELQNVEIASSKILGFLNDDSNPVGEVHLGVVQLLEVKHPNIKSNEEAIQNPHFVTIETLQQRFESLETWSQLSLKELKKCIRKTTYTFHSGSENQTLQLCAHIQAFSEEEATENLIKVLPSLVELHKDLDQHLLNNLGVESITIKLNPHTLSKKNILEKPNH